MMRWVSPKAKWLLEWAFLWAVWSFMVCVIIIEGFFPGVME